MWFCYRLSVTFRKQHIESVLRYSFIFLNKPFSLHSKRVGTKDKKCTRQIAMTYKAKILHCKSDQMLQQNSRSYREFPFLRTLKSCRQHLMLWTPHAWEMKGCYLSMAPSWMSHPTEIVLQFCDSEISGYPFPQPAWRHPGCPTRMSFTSWAARFKVQLIHTGRTSPQQHPTAHFWLNSFAYKPGLDPKLKFPEEQKICWWITEFLNAPSYLL